MNKDTRFLHFLHAGGGGGAAAFSPVVFLQLKMSLRLFKSLWLLGGAAVQLITRGRLKTDRLSLSSEWPTAD